MEMSCSIRFTPRVAVPLPLPARKPCIASWNWMEDDIRRLMIPDTPFHRTSTRPIPLKLMPPPLGIIITICQRHNTVSYPPLKAACMMATTFFQFPGSVSSSFVSARSHILRFLALMMDGPPAQCSRIHRTA